MTWFVGHTGGGSASALCLRLGCVEVAKGCTCGLCAGMVSWFFSFVPCNISVPFLKPLYAWPSPQGNPGHTFQENAWGSPPTNPQNAIGCIFDSMQGPPHRMLIFQRKIIDLGGPQKTCKNTLVFAHNVRDAYFFIGKTATRRSGIPPRGYQDVLCVSPL